ncbi:hypothetical protein EV356DRAFT_371619 [Viridothelium virens]|uniref:Uncharacterized protein n=1 Tax=Viridothelium virens TaxID=1048519 RepID=A0A6A6GVI7_VIRVR|nr:hypothetical protein EV356DRAFT_371619 [Viridothelium virens]
MDFYSPENNDFHTLVLGAVRVWLGVLSDCGIDLDGYGRREQQVFLQETPDVREHLACCSELDPRNEHPPNIDIPWSIECAFWTDGPVSHLSRYRSGAEIPPLRLANFTYGPRPEDWELQFESCEEEWIGTFWSLIERQEDIGRLASSTPPTPGGWVEEG